MNTVSNSAGSVARYNRFLLFVAGLGGLLYGIVVGIIVIIFIIIIVFLFALFRSSS
jgi:hypothetical protein